MRNAQKLALAVLGTGLLRALGYIYGVHQLYDLTRIATVALPTAISPLLLGSALLCLRPAEGVMAAVTANDIGGRAIRNLLPWCIGLPLVIGYLRLIGERMGIYDSAMGVVLLILLIICTICSLVYRNGAELSRRDADERRTQEALNRQAALLDLSPNAIIIRDIDGTIRYWSKGAEELFGWKSEEAVGQNTNSLLQTEFPEPFERIIEQLRRGQDWKGDLLQRTRSGRKVAVQGFWHGGTASNGFEILESNLDITDRKLAEEALLKNEERFRALVEASSDVLYRMSPDWKEMYYLHSRDFLANTEAPNPNWVEEYIHPEDQPHVMAAIGEAIRNKQVFELEHRVLREDGALGHGIERALLDQCGRIAPSSGVLESSQELDQVHSPQRVGRHTLPAKQRLRRGRSKRPVVALAAGKNHTASDSSIDEQAVVPVFDAEAALKRCFGRQEMLEEMVNLFPTESAELLNQMRGGLAHGDIAETGRAAHRLRGTLVFLGAQPAANAAEKTEQAARSGDPVTAAEAVEELEHEVELLRETLISHARKA